MLALERVDKTYGRRGAIVRALVGAGLDVRAGCLSLLSGPSGSGKTTLLHVAAGLLRPDAGRVSVAGHELTGMGEGRRARLRRQAIGIVFQRAHLLPFLDALGNVCVGGCDPVAAHAALEGVGLSDRLAHRPGELSAGEQQRVALVRALVRRPGLVLADEPTASLDADSARTVLGLLRAAADAGAAVLIASHDPQVRAAADEQWVIQAGVLSRR